MTFAPISRLTLTASDGAPRCRIRARGAWYAKRTSATSPTVSRETRPDAGSRTVRSRILRTSSTDSTAPSVRTT